MIKFKAAEVDLDKDAYIDEIVSIVADMLHQSLTESDSEDGSAVITCNVAKEPQLPPSAPPINEPQPSAPMTQIDILFREVASLKSAGKDAREKILNLHSRVDAANSHIKLQEEKVLSAWLNALRGKVYDMDVNVRAFSERFSQGDSRLAELNQYIREVRELLEAHMVTLS